jgi:hypothetical protein
MYDEQWEDYGKRWMMLGCVTLGGGPLVLIVCIILSQMMPKNYVDNLFPIVGGAWMVACVRAIYRLNYWRCPRCRQYYFQKGGLFNQLLQNRCQYCGLEIESGEGK